MAGFRLWGLALSPVLMLASAPLAQDVSVPQDAGQIALSFAPVVERASPAVVNIYASRVVQDRSSPFAGDPFFDQFFRDFGQAAPRVQNSLGSGVIVSDEGIVVSNYHVVGEASEIRVVLADRREYDATVILGDQESDLAILRLRGAEDLPALEFRDSDDLKVGDLVLAIGNPFGVGQTVSSGIISGLARAALQVGEGRGYFIQTDAPINPGNSGGALVDVQGRLVGINTAILTKSGGSNGIGFAIPANLVAAMVAQAEGGASRFARPWAGLSAQPVDAALAAALGMTLPEGVAVTDLHPASPFAKAGVATGDVILALGGQAVNTPQEMFFRLSVAGPGAVLALDWMSGGSPRKASVTVGLAPEDPPRDEILIAEDVPLRGARLSRINPAVATEWRLPMRAEGVIVTEAADYAARIGLMAGDVLLSINGIAIPTPAAAEAASRERTRRWQIDVIRGGQPLRLRFRL